MIFYARSVFRAKIQTSGSVIPSQDEAGTLPQCMQRNKRRSGEIRSRHQASIGSRTRIRVTGVTGTWSAMVSHGQPWSAMVSGQPWSAIASFAYRLHCMHLRRLTSLGLGASGTCGGDLQLDLRVYHRIMCHLCAAVVGCI